MRVVKGGDPKTDRLLEQGRSRRQALGPSTGALRQAQRVGNPYS